MVVRRKKVDEEWKSQVQKEKENIARETDHLGESAATTPTFEHLVSVFATQAMLQLGEVENPLTGQKSVDMVGAKYSIDMLQLLQEKTQGNLTEEEKKYLDSILYDLRMRYVKHSGMVSP